jgi:hypothetical protein
VNSIGRFNKHFKLLAVAVVILGSSAIASARPAKPIEPFCQSLTGINEIRDNLVCHQNPNLDACAPLTSQIYKAAGYTAVAAALASSTAVAAVGIDRLNAQTDRLLALTDEVMVQFFQMDAARSATVIEKPGGQTIKIWADQEARLKLIDKLEAQAMAGEIPSIKKAAKQAFGRTAILRDLSVEEQFAKRFVAARATVYPAQDAARVAGRAATIQLSKRIAFRAIPVIGEVALVGDAVLTGSPLGCDEVLPDQDYTNRSQGLSNGYCRQKNNYQPSPAVARFLNLPDQKKLEILRARPSVCTYYQSYRKETLPAFHVMNLKCGLKNESVKFTLATGGVRTDYTVRYNGSPKIQELVMKTDGEMSAVQVHFNAYGRPQSFTPRSKNSNIGAYFRAKLHVSAAVACCNQGDKVAEACLNQFNSSENIRVGGPASGASIR